MLLYILVLWLLIITLGPFLWMLSCSLKENMDLFVYPPKFLFKPTLEHFYKVIFESDLLVWIRNSLIVSITVAFLSVCVGVIGAFSVVRYRYQGRKQISQLFLFAYMLQPIIILVPLFLIINKLRLADNLIGLMVCYTTFSLPFCIWMLRSFIASVPIELEESAMIDGCTKIGALWRVVIPNILPGMIATWLFAFNLSWNEFMIAVTLISSSDNRTLTLGLYEYIGQWSVEWGEVMSVGLLASLPSIVMFVFLQKYFVSGITAGAVKG